MDYPEVYHRMTSEVEKRPGITVIRCTGEIDINDSPTLKAELYDWADDDASRFLIVDFSEVTFLDGSTVSALVGALKRHGRGRLTIAVVIPKTSLRRIFEITGVDQILKLCNTSEEAEAYFA